MSTIAPARSGASGDAGSRAGSRREWIVAPEAPADFLAAIPELHPVAAQVLYGRGLTSPDAVRAFLESERLPLHDPRRLLSMDRAVARVSQAVRRRERVAVHGDVDVDGVCAAAILTIALRSAGVDVISYLPQRGAGYGVRPEAVDRLAGLGARLLITGDTGTRAVDAVERAAAAGMDVVVTDHHLLGDALPDAAAVVNPQQATCSYPFKELSGAGVAWKLVAALALAGVVDGAVADELLDLVALGTIVDCSPLWGENRTLVQHGLRRLAERPRPGMLALAGRRPLDERAVAFSIGPRLNAAGRLDDAATALELLLTRDDVRAGELVHRLEEQNRRRQELTDQVVAAAREQASRAAGRAALVLAAEGWSGGVLGLVAARIAEEFGRPAFVIELRPDGCRGSARGGTGTNLVALLDACADLLHEYGGHAQAAGFATSREQLEPLAERLVDAASRLAPAAPAPLLADAAIDGDGVDWAVWSGLQPLRPFGAANPEPLFLMRCLPLLDARRCGAGGRHLQARVRCGRQTLHAFGPDLGALAPALRPGGRVDLLSTLDTSSWNGRESLELRLSGIRPSSTSQRRACAAAPAKDGSPSA